MAPWGWIAGGYGMVLILAAVSLKGVARKPIVLAACAAYALVALGLGTLDGFWIQLLGPAALLLGGYWLSGFFFHDPQPWLEAWLVSTDRRVFDRLDLNRRLAAAPAILLEACEAAYTAAYVVVGAGALIAAAHGARAVSGYWTIVLAAELACYGALPFLRSRPPRSLESPGIVEQRAPRLRRLNVSILDRASVQANTIPSGHVAGAVATSLAVISVSATAGWVLLGVAIAITVSAIAGRYHYAVDCGLGALVAVTVAAVLAL